MSVLKFAAKTRTILIKILETALMIAVAMIVLDVLWGVISRYVLGNQSSWTEELARVLLVWISLLGASVAFGIKGHLGVDYFVELMDPAAKRIMGVVANLVVLVFASSIILYGGIQLVARTFQLEQQMIAISIPKGYVYMAVPISGVFMIIFTIETIIEIIAAPLGGAKDA